MKSLLLIALAVSAVHQAPETSAAYTARISEWRKTHEADLMRAEGWLAVAGLYWLHEGDNPIGTSAGNEIVLPAGAAGDKVGTLSMRDGVVTLNVAPTAHAAVGGKDVSSVRMKPDDTRVDLGDLRIMAIRRGKRIGIRMFDFDARGRREFGGLKWFSIDPAYRIRAKYVAYDTPRTLSITNVLGDTAPVPNPGYVEFTLEGKTCRLEAQAQGDGLFFNFRDATSGHETYPAGRFLDAPGPKDGFVDLDFNQAVNPPCAFTKYATCPLPPSANVLNAAIRAGEKTHHPVGD